MADGECTRIREATSQDASGIARVSVDTWRATYRGIMPDDVLHRLSYEARERWFRETLEAPPAGCVYLVAEDAAEEIVGFVAAGPERTGSTPFEGEVYAIYVLPAQQGRGIGKRLMRDAARGLERHGFHSIMLWVAAGNHPSRRFYEGLGGQLAGAKHERFGDMTIEEVAYGWSDSAILSQEDPGPDRPV